MNEQTNTSNANTHTKPEHKLGLAAWAAVFGSSLTAIEETAWQARHLGESTAERLQILETSKNDLLKELKHQAHETSFVVPKLVRVFKTGLMLAKLSMDYQLWGTRSAFIPKNKTQRALDKLHQRNAKRFVAVSLEHGGAFLKVGQMLSARADLLPKVWVEELSILQDQASPEHGEAIRKVIETEFNDSLENLFQDFDIEPIACASIGQVHKATLKNGNKVAVKIQRPNIGEVLKTDMIVMKLFLTSLENTLPLYDLDTITKEIERGIFGELDYVAEADNMRAIAAVLEQAPEVSVPNTIDALCSTKVLTTEFIEGKKLTDALDDKLNQGDQAAISDILGRLLDMYFRQILGEGKFQADPHPGNILVQENDELVLLDFGCTMVLPEEFTTGYGYILKAAIAGDKEAVAEKLMGLGFRTRSGKPDTLIAFSNSLLETIVSFAQTSQGEEKTWPDLDDVIANGRALLNMSQNDPVEKIPAEFIMLARVFTTLGGLFTHFKPNIDINRYLLPHLMKVM